MAFPTWCSIAPSKQCILIALTRSLGIRFLSLKKSTIMCKILWSVNFVGIYSTMPFKFIPYLDVCLTSLRLFFGNVHMLFAYVLVYVGNELFCVACS